MHTDGRRVVITPGMVELGNVQDQENRNLGHAITQAATDVILVGETRTRPIKAGLEEAGFPPDRLHVVDGLNESIAWYQTHLTRGDTVLFLNDLPDTYS
jgi:UDP-N-acetylmuramoyl-tripeptide--D-alanyl-D-alanine ligase